MGNMDLWDAVARPPEDALKTITGGRLNGMTDIKPQWRLKAMTEQLGPVGKGWSYTIDRLWTEPAPDDQVFAFALVSVKVGDGAPIPGVGGSMLIELQKNGPHCNDDAYKMAVTDALSVALKSLGVAADIYLGKAHGSKYQSAPETVDGSAMLAKLFKVLSGALRGGMLTAKQHADAVTGLDTFLAKHPDKNVSDYTKAVEVKLQKATKGDSGEPAQPSEKGKAEIAETVARMAGKAAEQEELIPPSPEEDEGMY